MDKVRSTPARIAITLLAATFGTAYASDHIADDKIAVAKAAVEHAEENGAFAAAPVEMAAARDKLARAQRADADRHFKPAADLADQANIDAQVAEATAVSTRSRKAVAEFEAGLQTLRQEAAHSSQSNQ
jgi:hypothetical protein